MRSGPVDQEDRAEEDETLAAKLLEDVEECREMLETLTSGGLIKIPGATKLKHKLKKELLFLQSALDTFDPKAPRALDVLRQKRNTSNVGFLRGVMNKILAAKGEVVGVFRKFKIAPTVVPGNGTSKKHGPPGGGRRGRKPGRGGEIEVDLVTREGRLWVKVKAQAPLAIQHDIIAKEKGKTVRVLARGLAQAAKANLVHFNPPKCVIYFARGVTPDVKRIVEAEGVQVEGELVESSYSLFDGSTSEEEEEQNEEVSRPVVDPTDETAPEFGSVNLDTTSLITFISDLSNGGSRVFDDDLLQVMAKDEEKHPAREELMRHLTGRKWIVCETAVKSVRKIVELLGGPSEKKRAEDLLGKVTVVEDQPNEWINRLKGSKFSHGNKAVFGTGHTMRIPTVTSNARLIRSAQSQGLTLSVLTHPARALTERKARLKTQFPRVAQTCVEK